MGDDNTRSRANDPKDGGSMSLHPAVDFAVLDPTGDAIRFDAIVRSITASAMAARSAQLPSDDRVRRARSVLLPLESWSRPAFAAAAAIIVIAGMTLLLHPAPAMAVPGSFVESAGIPAPVARWAAATRSPSATELIDAFDVAPVAAARAPR